MIGCTFTGNTAQNDGGAICNYGTMGNVWGCTFTGNTATYGSGNAINSYGGMDANYNWWGSNDGPADGQIMGFICNTWLCMNISANPDSIAYNEPSTVTVSFNNGYGVSSIPPGVYIPDGTVVNFNSASGIFNHATAVTHNGIATVIFTGTSINRGFISATTDSQIKEVDIDIFKAHPSIIVDDVAGVNGQTVNLTATLDDEKDNPLNGKIVTFNVGGVDYNRTTDTNGVATLSYPISEAAGVYTVTASFAGDDNYILSSNTGTLTVNTIKTTLTVNNITSYNGKSVNLTATLEDENGNPLSGKTVTFTVNGTDYTAVTDINGIAALNYKLTPAGVYNINVSFVNGTVYANSTGNGTLTVKPTANLYINTKNINTILNMGETSLLIYKLGNYGPDEAKNVTVTFQIPEGLEFVNATADTGKYIYDSTTRTVTWTINSVPVGDPYLYLTVKASANGNYKITPKITSDTYNQNSEDKDSITIKVQSKNNNSNNGNSKSNNSINGNSNSATTVNAASKITKTVGLQDTGLPLNYLLLAVLMVIGGLIPKRR